MRRTPPPDRAAGLSPEQRQRLRVLLTRELHDAYSAALAAGASEADLAAELDERRRALAESNAGTEAGSAALDEVGTGPTPVLRGSERRPDPAQSGSAGRGGAVVSPSSKMARSARASNRASST